MIQTCNVSIDKSIGLISSVYSFADALHALSEYRTLLQIIANEANDL